MPLQKTYLSIEHKSTFGIITSNISNIVYDPSGKFAFAAALHEIHIWSLSDKNKIATLTQAANDSSNDTGSPPSMITVLLLSATNNQIISGHDDGSIKIWDYKLQKLLVTFNGHNSRVTSLSFNYDATKMASGGFDTDIIVWDMIAQRGLFRLRGHIKPITKIQFIQINDLLLNNNENNKNIKYTFNDQDNEMLISSSRDTSLKLWELDTQHCVQTIVGHKNEVWSFDISKDKQFIVSGGMDSEVYVWKIEPHVISDEELSDSDDSDDDDEVKKDEDIDIDMVIADNENEEDESKMVVSCISSIRVRSLGTVECGAMMGKKTRIVNIEYNQQNNLLFAQTNSSAIQLFYCRTNQEIKKRLQIRKQKEKKKLQTKAEFEVAAEEMNINIKLQGSDYLIGLTPIRTSHKLNSIDISETLICMKSLKTKKYSKQVQVSNKNKKKHQSKSMDVDVDNENNENDIILSNDDEANFEKLRSSLIKNGVSSDDVLLQAILLSYVNNMISIIYLPVPTLNNSLNFIKIEDWKKKYLPNYVELNNIYWEGHRTAVRSIGFSSDDSMIVSTCKNELKIWNTRSMKCIRNLQCEYGLKCIFAPGNKHVIVATKQGNILIYDLILNELIQKIVGHEGEVYSLCLTADKKGIVTGGGDGCIKIWKFNLKMIQNIKQLCISLVKSVKLQDEVLCVVCSADGRYLAASLLDNTIQIFFFDSMKFYLTLYGHKLPVFGMDISSDCTILVSGSADKNIKIWGIDHGDCKKSLFAHTDSVIQCKFVVNTHYFYSCSKDGLIKYWDADKFKKIQEIKGHSSEIWCIDLNQSGQLLISAGGDRSIRMYLESNQALFALQEEQKELESLFEKDLNKSENKPSYIEGSGLQKGLFESDKATKKTMNAIEIGESLMEAIQLCDNDIEKRKYCVQNKVEYVMNAQLRVGGMKSVEEYMFFRFKAISVCDIEQVFMIPPFEYLQSIFYYLKYCITNKQQGIEKFIRCLLFLIKYHHQQLLSSNESELKIQLKQLKEICMENLTDYRNKIGYNLQAMNYMQDVIKNKAKYAQEAERYKKHEIDDNKLYQTWTQNNDNDDDMQDID